MRLVIRAGLAALAIAFAAPPALADLSAGIMALQNGDHAAAIVELTPLAEAGDPVAQHQLALAYRDGPEADPAQALAWARKAAAQGMDDARRLVGEIAFAEFVYRADVRALEALLARVAADCPEDAKCAFDQVWRHIDVADDNRLSLAEIARFQRNVLKYAAAKEGEGFVEPTDIAALNITGVLLLPIAAASVLHSFDYDNNGFIERDEAADDAAFAAMVGVGATDLLAAVDLVGLAEKLEGLMLFLPIGAGGPPMPPMPDDPPKQ